MTGAGGNAVDLWAGMTVWQARKAVADALASAAVETPGLDARLLLEEATGLTAEALVLEPRRPLASDAVRRLSASTARRMAREPVSRIFGRRDFFGRTFEVTAATLDPRPDTETLVELALEIVREEGWQSRPLHLLDVGTGTGAILLTLLAEMPLARGVGTDVSEPALAVAARNSASLGLGRRSAWRRARSLEGVGGPYDLVVSNPPYIPSGVIPALDPEVRDYDPLTALDGGDDGMSIVRELVSGAAHCTRTTGWCVLEIGAGQAEAVRREIGNLFGERALAKFRTASDLGGHLRCVAWKPHF